MNLVRKIIKKKKNFTKRDIRKVIQNKSKQAIQGKTSMVKAEVNCYGCNEKGHYKSEFPQLKESKEEKSKK